MGSRLVPDFNHAQESHTRRISRTTVCWDPPILLPWQRNVTNSSISKTSRRIGFEFCHQKPRVGVFVHRNAGTVYCFVNSIKPVNFFVKLQSTKWKKMTPCIQKKPKTWQIGLLNTNYDHHNEIPCMKFMSLRRHWHNWSPDLVEIPEQNRFISYSLYY